MKEKETKETIESEGKRHYAIMGKDPRDDVEDC